MNAMHPRHMAVVCALTGILSSPGATTSMAQNAAGPAGEVKWFAGEQLDGSRPGATPAERPLRPFAGWLAARGCTLDIDMSFIGRVQEGTVSGMAADGTNFSFAIDGDGVFGGEITIGRDADGAAIFERVSGRVETDRLVIDVEYGVAGKPAKLCRGDDITLKLGG